MDQLTPSHPVSAPSEVGDKAIIFDADRVNEDRCPVCHGTSLHIGHIVSDGDVLKYPISCNDCGLTGELCGMFSFTHFDVQSNSVSIADRHKLEELHKESE